MKILIVLYSFFYPVTDSSLYGISFSDSKGETVEMSSFKGKRIMVFVTDSETPDIHKLDQVSNVSKNSLPTTEIIVIAASDLGKNDDGSNALSSSFSTAKEKFVLSDVMEVAKASRQQHPLLRWLTSSEYNKHFDRDAEEGIIFMINEEGVLYGVHSKQIDSKMLKHVMEQNINQDNQTEHNP